MDDVKRILVVSRETTYCRKAVHYGVSLSRKYGAELYVMHVVHDPFIFGGWNLPMPSREEAYKQVLQEAKRELRAIVKAEKKRGMTVRESVREGNPADEIIRMVQEEGIDLLIMLAHEEGHMEHFLFGRSNEEVIRRMPCSVLMVKKEPAPVRPIAV